ncbi:MAG: SPOR domain-containing protein [Treponema sp.]|jgi:hypothetical protein|nr:SPOR domain-containing protein [Treponema sp.]
MRKLVLLVAASAVAVVFIGASIWEGSAAVSIGGELPDGGYYAATKSFPRNTVVDITNLETGKSVRVIVAAGLDSPGLLAVLSKEAAEVIGIQSRSIGRIRMTMPADPIAFSRFTDGANPNGDPDYDPRAAIAAMSPVQAEQTTQTPPQPIIPPGPAVITDSLPPVWDSPALPAPVAEASRDEQLSGNSVIPADKPASGENVPWPWEWEPAVSSSSVSAPAEGSREANSDFSREFGPGYPLAIQAPEMREDSFPSAAYTPLSQTRQNAASGQEPDNTAPARSGIVLEPATPRPPDPYMSLPSEIIPITSSLPPTAPAGAASEIPSQNIIPETPSSGSTAPEAARPEKPLPAQTAGNQSIQATTAESASNKTAAEPRFSAPLIGALEKGMYYLQLRAYSRTELVQAELSRLGNAYPVAILAGVSQEKPIYRVLIGPVNLGESSALLRRFKGSGYDDAFVRQGE